MTSTMQTNAIIFQSICRLSSSPLVLINMQMQITYFNEQKDILIKTTNQELAVC